MTKGQLRNFWFQFHKWIGLILAALILPICVTGAALVWHDGLEKLLNPGRFAVTGTQMALPVGDYVRNAQAVLKPGERIASLRFESGEPVVISATRPAKRQGAGRPVRTIVWLDPVNAKVLDSAASDAGLVRVMHNIHGNLMIPGMGRQIVGWIGVAMLISSISGPWLWWPTVGNWLRGLRWKRHRNFDTNLHHMMGFWIALPLFVLSLTGAWISFPAFFGNLSGAQQQQRGPGGGDRFARFRAQPLDAPATSLDRALAAADAQVAGKATSVEWPTDMDGNWTITLNKGAVKVDSATGVASAAKSRERGQEPETLARLMRRIHDGTGMGLIWQWVIFLGGIFPAVLTVTGVIMWWRARKWRGDLKARQRRKPEAI